MNQKYPRYDEIKSKFKQNFEKQGKMENLTKHFRRLTDVEEHKKKSTSRAHASRAKNCITHFQAKPTNRFGVCENI